MALPDDRKKKTGGKNTRAEFLCLWATWGPAIPPISAEVPGGSAIVVLTPRCFRCGKLSMRCNIFEHCSDIFSQDVLATNVGFSRREFLCESFIASSAHFRMADRGWQEPPNQACLYGPHRLGTCQHLGRPRRSCPCTFVPLYHDDKIFSRSPLRAASSSCAAVFGASDT